MSNYLTSYCNQYHRLSDGKPVEHECYVIPPEALEAEREGQFHKAIELMDSKKMARHKGAKEEP